MARTGTTLYTFATAVGGYGLLGLIIAGLPRQPMDSNEDIVPPALKLLAVGMSIAGMTYCVVS